METFNIFAEVAARDTRRYMLVGLILFLLGLGIVFALRYSTSTRRKNKDGN